MSERRAISAEVEAAVLRMDAGGERVVDIQSTTGLARASVYWVLQKNDIRPDRIHRERNTDKVDDTPVGLTEKVRVALDLIRRHREGELEAEEALLGVDVILRNVTEVAVQVGAAGSESDDDTIDEGDLVIAIPRSVRPEYFAAALGALVEQNPLMLVTSVYEGETLLDETQCVEVDDPAVGKIPSLRGSVVDEHTYALTGEDRTIALRWIGRVAVPDPFKR